MMWAKRSSEYALPNQALDRFPQTYGLILSPFILESNHRSPHFARGVQGADDGCAMGFEVCACRARSTIEATTPIANGDQQRE